jgi:predicted ATPase/DNA-binding SARP family transcriptional activator
MQEAGRQGAEDGKVAARDGADSRAQVSTSTLASALTSFVGREREMAALGRELELSCLVTLIGPGGVGKTRLALETARQQAERFPDGLYWCDLASVSDPACVSQTVAAVLQGGEQPGLSALEVAIELLSGRQVLVVLDNCEQVLAACAETAAILLWACPHIKILATSLQPLGLPQERAWPVPPLEVPDISQPAADVQSSDAVRLFVERAAEVLPGFAPDRETMLTIAHICRRLDGLPLAIELAAARVGLLTVEQIAARLEDPFRLLTRGKTDTLPRHQTLRATMDWTYQFLDADERDLLQRLSVFRAPFTLEMAELLCEGTGSKACPTGVGGVLDVLAGLVDKSFAIVVPRSGRREARYRLLEPVRQYAREKLEASGQAAEVRTRLLEWAVALAERAEAEWPGTEGTEWLDRLDLDHENLLAALRWVRTGRQVDQGLRLAKALWHFWYTRGYWSEGRAWCEELLALATETEAGVPPVDNELRARVLFAAGSLAYQQRDLPASARRLEESVALYRAGGAAEALMAEPVNMLAAIARALGGSRSPTQPPPEGEGKGVGGEGSPAQAPPEGKKVEAARGVEPFPIQPPPGGGEERGRPELRVFLLGPPQVMLGERTLAACDWKYAKARELFFYLVANPPASKEQIGLDLWPDSSPRQLRNIFHRVTYYARRALGHPEWIVFAGEVYAFDRSAPYWCDLDEFEARLREAGALLARGLPAPTARARASICLEEAVKLWRGEFLQGLDAGEWTIFRREALGQAFLQALLDLGQIYLAESRYSDATATFHRLLSFDNYFEVAHRELMRCYARQGDVARALRHFHDLQRLMEEELGARPSAETLVLYEQLRRGDDV